MYTMYIVFTTCFVQFYSVLPEYTGLSPWFCVVLVAQYVVVCVVVINAYYFPIPFLILYGSVSTHSWSRNAFMFKQGIYNTLLYYFNDTQVQLIKHHVVLPEYTGLSPWFCVVLVAQYVVVCVVVINPCLFLLIIEFGYPFVPISLFVIGVVQTFLVLFAAFLCCAISIRTGAL
jgi:hypothetical protein